VNAEVAGNLKVSELNNEMSTWRPRYRTFPLTSCLMLTFCGTLACACQYLLPGATTRKTLVARNRLFLPTSPESANTSTR